MIDNSKLLDCLVPSFSYTYHFRELLILAGHNKTPIYKTIIKQHKLIENYFNMGAVWYNFREILFKDYKDNWYRLNFKLIKDSDIINETQIGEK